MAQIDHTVYNALGRGVKSYQDYENEGMQRQSNALALQAAQRQNELGGLQMEQTRADMTETNALRDVLRNTSRTDPDAAKRILQAAPIKGQGIIKGWREEEEAGHKSKKVQLENAALETRARYELHDRFMQGMGGVQSPDQFVQYLQQGVQSGAVSEQGAAGALQQIQQNPAAWQQVAQRMQMMGVDVKTQLEQKWKAIDAEYRKENDSANRGVTVRGQDLSASTAVRGQNLVNARGIEANRIKQSEVNMGGKPPPGYRWDGTGKLVPIPGGPGEVAANKASAEAAERDRGLKATVTGIEDQIRVLDKALDHPGRSTATGASGTLDPRNYIPGTHAKDFQVVLDQIGGTAFLQAFESLKGGGQITEVEGRKATEAIARLNRAQSDGEFENALTDLREVMNKGYERHTGKRIERPGKTAPAASGFDADKERRYQEWKAKQQ